MPSPRVESSSPRERAFAAFRRHRVLVLLVGADVATKMAAFSLLPEGRMVAVPGGLTLSLAVNDWGVMGGVQGIGAVTANPAYTLLLALGLVALALVIVRLGSSALSFASRVAVGTAAFFGVAFAAQAVSAGLSHLRFPADVVVTSIRVAALLLSVSLYAASRAWLPRTAFTLLAAGALANASSHAYPPFEVVDFLVVPLAPFLAVMGGRTGIHAAAGGGAEMVGVINLADLYVFAFPLVMAAWPLAFLWRKANPRASVPATPSRLRRRADRDYGRP